MRTARTLEFAQRAEHVVRVAEPPVELEDLVLDAPLVAEQGHVVPPPKVGGELFQRAPEKVGVNCDQRLGV